MTRFCEINISSFSLTKFTVVFFPQSHPKKDFIEIVKSRKDEYIAFQLKIMIHNLSYLVYLQTFFFVVVDRSIK